MAIDSPEKTAAPDVVKSCCAHHVDEDGAEEHENPLAALELLRIGFVALVVVLTWAGILSGPTWLLPAAAVIGGYPILHEAWEAVLERRMTMELSMSIALVAAAAIGEFFTTLVIILFVLVAEVLEGLTVGQGRRAIKTLLDLLPQRATVRRPSANPEARADETEEVNASGLAAGDVVVVRPGERLPIDGVVVTGNSFVDESAITGESMPAEKIAGRKVFAGTINQTGTLDVRVTGVGRDTAYGHIIEAVERAEKSRAPVQRLADRMAGYLVYFALTCAAITWLVTRDARATISVIIVAGACGIAAGTPLAILGAIGRAARMGAIIKGGLYLERLGTIETIVLDKTGTLTLGTPEATRVVPVSGWTEADVWQAAATAERPSEHPLGRAIVAGAIATGVVAKSPDSFTYTPGKGIVCHLNGTAIQIGSRRFLTEAGIETGALDESSGDVSEVLVARDGALLGAIHVADRLRHQTIEGVRQLRDMGLKIVLLTGDRKEVADAIGRALAVDEVHAELLPEDKLEHVRRLQSGGTTVAMVGDGINDAPALVEASVGVAMGSGTDVARESADVVLLGNDLLKFAHTLKIARKCRRIIWQNFAGTIAVDAVGVGMAAFGLLNPLLAAFIHVTSELAFILNSTRLLPRGAGKP